MRRIAALQTCLALALAYSIAPFQHVHADGDHSTLVHSHFYGLPEVHGESEGPQIDHDDDHAKVQSLDAFTLVFAPGNHAFVLDRGHFDVLRPSSSRTPIEPVDECANDPPGIGRSNPRAPPA
jgi:hypothetical protein